MVGTRWPTWSLFCHRYLQEKHLSDYHRVSLDLQKLDFEAQTSWSQDRNLLLVLQCWCTPWVLGQKKPFVVLSCFPNQTWFGVDPQEHFDRFGLQSQEAVMSFHDLDRTWKLFLTHMCQLNWYQISPQNWRAALQHMSNWKYLCIRNLGESLQRLVPSMSRGKENRGQEERWVAVLNNIIKNLYMVLTYSTFIFVVVVAVFRHRERIP